MAAGPSSQDRRRNTRGIYLLPGQDNIKDLPTGIPDEDRLRILLRLCFKHTLSTLNEEIDSFEDIHQKLLLRGLSMFDEDSSDDSLSNFIKITTSTAEPACDAPVTIAANHHKQLQSLTAECERWKELLAMEVSLNLELESQPTNDDSKIPASRQQHYDMLATNAERARRVAAAIAARIQAMDSDSEAENLPGDDTDDIFHTFGV